MKKEKNPVKLGVVGLGRAGWGMQQKELAKKKDLFEVVAACDEIPERVTRAENELGCKGYATIEELLADPEVELVDIATRNCDHFAHAKLALEAGKNVLLEKPMTINVEQAKELLSMANGEGQPRLFVRQNRRFEPIYTDVQQLVDSGVLGDIFEINISQKGYQRRDDWQTLDEFGGGQCLNWGPHILDQALMLLGAPVVQQESNRYQVAAGGDCEDHFTVHLVGENGRQAHVCVSGASALNTGRRYAIHGSRGSIEVVSGYVHFKYMDPKQVMPEVVSSPATPGQSFGAAGTFVAKVNPDWVEKEYQYGELDMDTWEPFWNHVYGALRLDAEYPIKDEQLIALMDVLTKVHEAPLVVMNQHRDAL